VILNNYEKIIETQHYFQFDRRAILIIMQATIYEDSTELSFSKIIFKSQS